MSLYVIAFIGSMLLVLYIARLAGYALAISRTLKKKKKSLPGNDEGPFPMGEISLTLLVPFRNEENNLPGLIMDTMVQLYPTDKFEVLFINDHSNDSSVEIIERLSKDAENIRLLNLPGYLQGKKEAISLGVREARYGTIIQVDADCRLPRGFIREHAAATEEGKEIFVAGPVGHAESSHLWDNIEALEFMSLIGSSMASFIEKRPVMCNGANLSYSKTFYLRNEQEIKHIPTPSGDDIFLLIRAKREGMEMKYLLSENAFVTTIHSGSVKAFMQQRIRWGSKARFYADIDMIYLALLILLMNLYIIGTLVAAFIDPAYLHIFALSLLLKSLADFLLLNATARQFQRKRLLWYFPLVALFYYFYLVLAGFLSLFTGYHWKGRNYKNTGH